MCELRYRGSIKHKLRPGGGFGTLCPNWTHRASSHGLAGDPANHPWEETQAHAMLAESVLEGGRRYATRRNIAFVAVPSGTALGMAFPCRGRTCRGTSAMRSSGQVA